MLVIDVSGAWWVSCWLKKEKAGTDSLKVDGVAIVLSREAEFSLGQLLDERVYWWNGTE